MLDHQNKTSKQLSSPKTKLKWETTEVMVPKFYFILY